MDAYKEKFSGLLRSVSVLVLSVATLMLLFIGGAKCIAPEAVDRAATKLVEGVGINWTWSNDKPKSKATADPPGGGDGTSVTAHNDTPAAIENAAPVEVLIVPVEGTGTNDKPSCTRCPPALPPYTYPPIPNGNDRKQPPSDGKDSPKSTAVAIAVIPAAVDGPTQTRESGAEPSSENKSKKSNPKLSPAPSIAVMASQDALTESQVLTISLNNAGSNAVQIQMVEVEHSFECDSGESNGPERMSLSTLPAATNGPEHRRELVAVAVDIGQARSVVQQTVDNLSIPPQSGSVAGELSFDLYVRRFGESGCGAGQSTITVRVITDAGAAVGEPRSWPYNRGI